MSVHVIYYKDGAKMMRPVLTREEYLSLRNSTEQVNNVRRIRLGEEALKPRLLQMNYSCLPNEDGSLKGSKLMSTTVGMDIDHIPQEQMQTLRECILEKHQELGLLMLEVSVRQAGYHLVFRRRPELTQEENLRWASDLLGVDYDKGAKDITRVFFTTTASQEDLLFLEDEIFTASPGHPGETGKTGEPGNPGDSGEPGKPGEPGKSGDSGDSGESGNAGTPDDDDEDPAYDGLPYAEIIDKWWELYNDGRPPMKSNRDVLTFELAVNLRHICGFDRKLLGRIIPCYDDFSETQKMKCIDSALAEKRTQMPRRLRDVLAALKAAKESEEQAEADDDSGTARSLWTMRRMPQGVKDSIEAVGPALAMPVVTAICPCIGALATGVVLDVHGQKKGLNLISYIAGDFASGKGGIDPVVEAWMSEVAALDLMYQRQEEEWRAKKRAAKNKKEQPEEPKLPVRCLTLNNTVANLAERLANTEGKHAFSFTPEADTVAQKWKTSMSDFSVMLRQSYDGTKYEREARSADAVNVHIAHLLWNVTMCGTPDALYRVVSNYTDGFQSRIAVARTPDNTFAPLEDKPYVLTPYQYERIRQIAHLLPLIQGEAVLPRLEATGREWVEGIRQETMKNDDKVRARQRFRVCVTAQRMTCCLMLCRVCERLIHRYGLSGAETRLKQEPGLWKEMLLKTQTPSMMKTYGVIADALLENALFFFRDRIENAFNSRDYAGYMNGERLKRGKNDSIYERLDVQFTQEQAMQQAVAVKGAGVTRNAIRQMLKNWRKQKLIEQTEEGRYRKL